MNSIRATTIVPAVAAIFLCASCGTINRNVTAREMEERLRVDTEMIAASAPSISWSYVGSTSERHCFRRTTVRLLVAGFQDGKYCVSRPAIDLDLFEYPYGEQQSPIRGIFAFTAYDEAGRPRAYSMQYGVFEGWGNGPRWTEAAQQGD